MNILIFVTFWYEHQTVLEYIYNNVPLLLCPVVPAMHVFFRSEIIQKYLNIWIFFTVWQELNSPRIFFQYCPPAALPSCTCYAYITAFGQPRIPPILSYPGLPGWVRRAPNTISPSLSCLEIHILTVKGPFLREFQNR